MKHRVNLPRARAKVKLTPRQQGAIEAKYLAEKKRLDEIQRRVLEKRANKNIFTRAALAIWRTLKFGVVLFLTQWSGR